jgi:hypothetical protein
MVRDPAWTRVGSPGEGDMSMDGEAGGGNLR